MAGARTVFAQLLYCAMAAESATMVVMAIMAMNTEIMRRDVVDPPGSVLGMSANLLLFAVSSLGTLG